MNPHSIVCLNVKKLLAQRNSLHGQLAKWFEWLSGFKSCHLKNDHLLNRVENFQELTKTIFKCIIICVMIQTSTYQIIIARLVLPYENLDLVH